MRTLIEKTVGQFLAENASEYGEGTALTFGREDWSFREIDEITDLLAERLTGEYGLSKGEHAGLWSVNTPEFIFLFLACLKCGVVPIALNTCYVVKELSPILDSMDIRVLFYGEGWKHLVYRDMIPELKRRVPGVRSFVPMNELGSGGHLRTSSFPEAEDLPSVHERVLEKMEQVSCHDVACIVMTSGTTLSPKGVMLSHYNIVNDGRFAASYLRWNHNDRMLLALPMFHCFGLITGIVVCTMVGMTMDVLPYFGTEAVWRTITEHHCSVMNGVPSIYLALVRKEEYKDVVCHDLKSGIIGGAEIRIEDYLEICRHFPDMHLQSSYGMTEGSPSITFVGWDDPPEIKAKSCGKFMELLEGRIVSTQDGSVLPPGKEGELQIRGFNVTSGYYNMPEETRKSFTDDGWFRTGDIGRMDEEGNLYITGRLKEMIIRAGENISVAEIEHAIMKSGMAAAVKVVGVHSSFRQEEIAALIVPSDQESFREEELRNYLSGRLAMYKIPRYMIVRSALPMTGSGKIDLHTSAEAAEEYVRSLRRQKESALRPAAGHAPERRPQK